MFSIYSLFHILGVWLATWETCHSFSCQVDWIRENTSQVGLNEKCLQEYLSLEYTFSNIPVKESHPD